MTIPEPSENYTTYRKYTLPHWAKGCAAVVLSVIAFYVIWWIDPSIWPLSTLDIVAGLLGCIVTLFVHELIHYLTGALLGYNPNYEWPNRVTVPDQDITSWESVAISVAPQILCVFYSGVLTTGVGSGLGIAISSGLWFNAFGGYSDIPMAIRRLTWPSNIELHSKDGNLYISFPKNDGNQH